jgi:hypothetical protein
MHICCILTLINHTTPCWCFSVRLLTFVQQVFTKTKWIQSHYQHFIVYHRYIKYITEFTACITNQGWRVFPEMQPNISRRNPRCTFVNCVSTILQDIDTCATRIFHFWTFLISSNVTVSERPTLMLCISGKDSVGNIFFITVD